MQAAAMLSDADFTPSAAATCNFNQHMTVNLNKEVPFIKLGPDTTKFFCDVVVGGGFSSETGKLQSNSTIAHKIAQAEQLIYQREHAKDQSAAPSNNLENNG
tara:strand:- start:719 stop:1024 length:306 start_codon:yes stop_codon:yes gene_type:complete